MSFKLVFEFRFNSYHLGELRNLSELTQLDASRNERERNIVGIQLKLFAPLLLGYVVLRIKRT